MGKQTRSASSDSLTPSSEEAPTAQSTDPSTAYSDPMALQGAPGGGNAAVAAVLASQGSEPSDLCAGIGMVSSVGQNRLVDQTLEDIYLVQGKGLEAFEGAAKGKGAPYSEALAVTVAQAIVSSAISEVATLAVGAVAAYTGIGVLIAGAFVAGAKAARGKVASDLAKKIVGATDDPSSGWLKGFVEAQSDALFEGQRETKKAWIKATDGIESERLCGLNEALEAVLAAAEGVQYRHCVAGWAEYCGRQASQPSAFGGDHQREGFARDYELRIHVALDAADPRNVVVEGGAIPGLTPDLLRQPHMAGVTVANAGFHTRVVLAGGEILVGAGGRVLDVRTPSAEAREQLRRLGSEEEKSAAPPLWAATTGPLGDDHADLHVQNGAQKLVSLHVAPKTLASLGLPAPGVN